jgi:transcription elongation factor B subunit 1
VRYFYYKLKHTNHQGPLPEFKIAPELALELLMAANFLDT